MPRFDFKLSKLFGAPFRGSGLCFTCDGESILIVQGGRLIHMNLISGHSKLLQFESYSNIVSLSVHLPLAITIDETGWVSLINIKRNGILLGRVHIYLRGRNVRENALAFSKCGNMWAVGIGNRLEIWNVLQGKVPVFGGMRKLIAFNTKHEGDIVCVEWSPCSTRIVTGGSDYTCRIFLVGHWAGDVQGDVVMRDGEYWNIGSGKDIAKGDETGEDVDGDGDINGLNNEDDEDDDNDDEDDDSDDDELYMDFNQLSVCKPLLRLPPRVLRKPTVLYGHRSHILRVLFHGKNNLLTISIDGILFHWRVRYHQRSGVRREGHFIMTEARLLAKHFLRQSGAKRLHSAALNEGLLSVGLSNGVFALFRLDPEDTEVDEALFDMRDRPPVKVTDIPLVQALSVSKGPLSHVDISKSGEWLALGCRLTGQLVVWEWRSETHILKQQGHSLATTSLAFSPDGRAIATGGMDGQVKLWSPNTGLCVTTFSDHTSAVTDIVFSAKDVIVSSSRDGTVRAFDIRRYRNFRIFVAPPPARQFRCVAADTAGELIAAGCIDTFEVIVWSLRTGRVLEVLTGHKGPVESLAFRPNRGTLASASWDRTVRLWDMYERKGSCETLEHSKECLAVEYRPDGKEFAVSTMSGEVVIWDAEHSVIVGTIDGARDAAGGRLKTSRTKAPTFGYFNTISYSADGKYLLAGSASKDICIYKTGEGRVLGLIRKYTTTQNRSIDGTMKKLSGKRMTEAGVPLDLIDEDPSDEDEYREQRAAEARSVPGAPSENLTRRKNLLKVETLSVRFNPTGRSWGAVTTEGVLMYSLDAHEGAVTTFDPTDLDLEATPEAARAAAKERKYVVALLIALRLNETVLIDEIIDQVPSTEVSSVVSMLPPTYFSLIANFFAKRLDSNPRIEFNLMWVRRLLMSHGDAARKVGNSSSALSASMLALQRASNTHFKRLAAVADFNSRTLDYLYAVACRSVAPSSTDLQAEHSGAESN